MKCNEPNCLDNAAYVCFAKKQDSKEKAYRVEYFCNYHGPLAYVKIKK